MDDTEVVVRHMVPPWGQAAMYEAYAKSLKLFVAYGVLVGFIRIV